MPRRKKFSPRTSSTAEGQAKGAPLPYRIRMRILAALARHKSGDLAAMCGTSPNSVLRASQGTPVSHEVSYRLFVGLIDEARIAATDLLSRAEARWASVSFPMACAEEDDLLQIATLVDSAERVLWQGSSDLRARAARLIEEMRADDAPPPTLLQPTLFDVAHEGAA